MLSNVITPVKKIALTAAFLAASTSVALAGGMKDIVDTAVSAGNFTTLVTAVQKAGLVDTLKSPGPFTVFAPTDEAFAKVPGDVLNRLLADKEALTKVLTYHVVAGRVMAADVVKLNAATTVEGSMVAIKSDANGVTVGNAAVVATDIKASNGVIHVIDTVLLPKSVTDMLTSARELDQMQLAWESLGHEK